MSSSIDIARARAETRACENIIHFNNAGSSLMPAPVADYLHEFLRKEENMGGYETVDAEREALEKIADASPLWFACWSAVLELDERRNWLVLLDPLDSEFLETVESR